MSIGLCLRQVCCRGKENEWTSPRNDKLTDCLGRADNHVTYPRQQVGVHTRRNTSAADDVRAWRV